ncbi:MAG TPA: DUF2778 domain-containing protein [Methylocella sp.]|nr:DUF2778 domain-containing protein [Methylocella sp.]
MLQGINTGLEIIPAERGRLFSRVLSPAIQTAIPFALSALIGVWILYRLPAHGPTTVEKPDAGSAVALVSDPYGELVDPRAFADQNPVWMTQNIPLESNPKPNSPALFIAAAEEQKTEPAPASAFPQFGENAPMPVPRPTDLAPLKGPSLASLPPVRRFAQHNPNAIPSADSSDNRTFFQRFFGGLFESPKQALAYAPADDGAVGPARRTAITPLLRYDRWTAVYDIAAHTVYMPDGRRLEAHSGLGSMLDDPRYVQEPMRGPTPPNVYELQPREQLFHGVAALRLIPVANGNLYGRTGLLAHTYMLGPNGASNGCVSFKDYGAFLQAYQNGQIKRLVVVARQS